MIHSMTAFARSQQKGDWGSAIWELRSVNHRYLDLSIKLPDSLRELENAVRERLRDALGRGKVDAYLKFQPGPAVVSELSLNDKLVAQLGAAAKNISQHFPDQAQVNLMDVMRWPGLIVESTTQLSKVHEPILAGLEEAMESLKNMRHQEGTAINSMLTERLDKIAGIVGTVRVKLPDILEASRQSLHEKFQAYEDKIDKDRLEQEMVYVAQRMDVSEELDRLDTHVSEVSKVLKNGGLVGRRLDFFMQELNREANTLGSKSQDGDQTLASVDLKVLIEQMREQVQNIE